jgi:hypothetical protein
MEKINIKNFVTFANLKVRTLKTIREHKTMLSQINHESKRVVAESGAVRLARMLRNEASFTFFIKLNFFSDEARLSAFLATLRSKQIDYLITDFAALKGSFSDYSTFLETNASKGALLIISTPYEEEYYRVMASVLRIEQELNKDTVNYFRLLFVRENSFILLFNAHNISLRKIYELRDTKQSILLETLSILNYPALSFIESSGRVLNELAHIFDALRISSSHSSFEIK